MSFAAMYACGHHHKVKTDTETLVGVV